MARHAISVSCTVHSAGSFHRPLRYSPGGLVKRPQPQLSTGPTFSVISRESYKLVGKEADSDKTFLGKVVLKKRGTKLDVVRLIDGARIRGIGWIDFVTADRIKILRMRFHTSKGQFEGAYMFCSDLDNFARITGYFFPGFEIRVWRRCFRKRFSPASVFSGSAHWTVSPDGLRL